MLFSLDSGLPVSTKLPEDHDPERTVCFTGHREKSIQPFEGNPLYRPLTVSAVKLMIYRCIDLAVGQGYNCFISGLATGTDLWAAEYVMKKKLSGKKLSLIGAIPYLRHAERFPQDYKIILRDVEKCADCLVTVSDSPNITYGKGGGNVSQSLYRDRNYFMVDNSSAVIAFFNSSEFKSGTYQTLSYAERNGKSICRFGLGDIFRLMSGTEPDMRKIARKIASAEGFPDLVL